VANQEQFFRALGTKVRTLRKKQVEAGRPITVTTLLRICEVFELPMAKLVRGLDEGIYEKLDVVPQVRKKRRS